MPGDDDTQQKLEQLEKEITSFSADWVVMAMEKLQQVKPLAEKAISEEISKLEERKYSEAKATDPEIEGVKGAVSILEEITDLLKKLLEFVRKLRGRKDSDGGD